MVVPGVLGSMKVALDVDTLLLDRVFQPVVNECADLLSSFALARASLVLALLLDTAALAWTLGNAVPLISALLAGATLATFVGAQQLRTEIDRAERQSRPGLMNVRRVTMRLLRCSFLFTGGLGAVVALQPDATVACACVCIGNLFWLATSHFLSCSAAPPSYRRAPAFAGAR